VLVNLPVEVNEGGVDRLIGTLASAGDEIEDLAEVRGGCGCGEVVHDWREVTVRTARRV
jgi:hypothetical protein